MASFQLDLPTDMQTVMAEREGKILANTREKSIIDLARPREEAEIESMNSGSAVNRENVHRSKTLLPFEQVIKKAEADTAQQQVKELMSTAEGRQIASDVQKVADKDLLELWETDPKQAQRLVRSTMRVNAAQADLATQSFQTQEKFQAITDLESVFKREGLAGVKAIADQRAAQYFEKTGEELYPKDMPLTTSTLGAMFKNRDDLVMDLDTIRKLSVVDAQAAVTNARSNADIRADEDQQRQEAAYVRPLAGASLSNKFNLGKDTKGFLLLGEEEELAPSYGHLESLTNSLLLDVYKLTKDEAQLQEIANSFVDGHVKMEYNADGWAGGGALIVPNTVLQEDLDAAVEAAWDKPGATAESVHILMNATARKERDKYKRLFLNNLTGQE